MKSIIKKFAALVLALTIIFSMNITAAAESCSHPKSTYTYDELVDYDYDGHTVAQYRVTECSICGTSEKTYLGTVTSGHIFRGANIKICTVCGMRDESSVKK